MIWNVGVALSARSLRPNAAKRGEMIALWAPGVRGGHRGLVGSAIARRLAQLKCDLVAVGRDQLDLLRQDETERFLLSTKPDVIIVAAAKVGGIHANSTLPAQFIYENLTIASNLIHGAFRAGVRKLLFLGSSCTYPKLAPQPIIEEELLSRPLEPTR